MSLTAQELAGAYSKAWVAHDVQAIVALHTSESVFHVHGLTEPAVGHVAIREAVTAFLAQAPDLRFEATRGYLGDDHLVLEYVMSGTSGGRPFACDGVDVIAIDDGLVQRKDTYLDLAAYEQQGLPTIVPQRPIVSS
jgi:ketosteroid isomerase-like protein